MSTKAETELILDHITARLNAGASRWEIMRAMLIALDTLQDAAYSDFAQAPVGR